MGDAERSPDCAERGPDRPLPFRGLRGGECGAGLRASFGAARRFSGEALYKAATSLRGQAALRRELTVLTGELRSVRAERDALRTACARRVGELEDEVLGLRRERESLRDILKCLPSSSPVPPERLVSQPLVLRSPQGEFLGIAGRRGRPMSLADFLLCIERGGPAGCRLCSFWERRDAAWRLTLAVSGPAETHCLTLECEARRTPNGNSVSLLRAFVVDGESASRERMLRLFRQLRELLQD